MTQSESRNWRGLTDAELLERASQIVQWAYDVRPVVTREQHDETVAVKGAIHRAKAALSETEDMKAFARRIEDQREALRGALEQLLASGPEVSDDDLRTLAAKGHKQAVAVLKAREVLK